MIRSRRRVESARVVTAGGPMAYAEPVSDQWVPVDRRWWGLDRATFLPALVVAGLALLMIWVVPAIDRAFPAGERVAAGDQVGLADNVQFTPATDWVLTDGAKVGDATRSGSYPASATVTNGAVAFSAKVGRWDGTPTELLAQIQKTNAAIKGGYTFTGNRVSVLTTDGHQGVLQTVRGTNLDGLIAAFVIDGAGVEVTVVGPPAAPGDPSRAVVDMLTSVRAGAEGGSQ